MVVTQHFGLRSTLPGDVRSAMQVFTSIVACTSTLLPQLQPIPTTSPTTTQHRIITTNLYPQNTSAARDQLNALLCLEQQQVALPGACVAGAGKQPAMGAAASPVVKSAA